MNNKLLGLVLISILLTLTALVLVVSREPKNALGSVDSDAGGYYATTTRNSTGAAIASSTVLKAGPGIYGSFIITGAGAAPVTFYDATTTNVNLRTGNKATSSLKVLADFPASTAVGTYVFDGVFNDGLIMVITGSSQSVATATVTHK